MAVRDRVNLDDLTPEQMREALEQLREAEEFDFAIERAMAESIVAEPEVTAPSRPDIDERALRGALYLDEHYPGWAERINLSRFNLRNQSLCIVGQLAGDYYNGFKRIFGKKIEYHGKVTDFEEKMGVCFRNSSDFDVVEKSWRILIRERRDRAASRMRGEA